MAKGSSQECTQECTQICGLQAGKAQRETRAAVISLLTGALIWGLIWYPYRILRDAGVDGVVASTATYAVALVLGLAFFRRSLCAFSPSWPLFWLALAAGGCNLGYVLATLSGEVVRVLLLFYLAPLWTVLLSRLLLGERLNRFGVFVIALSLAGAATMSCRIRRAPVCLCRRMRRTGSGWAPASRSPCSTCSRVRRRASASKSSRWRPSSAWVLFVGVLLILCGTGLTEARLPRPWRG